MIEIGTTIHLEPRNNLDASRVQSHLFKCRLVDKGENTLIVDHPMNESTGKLGFFYEGFQFNAWYVGKDQAIYSFETSLQGREKGNIPMFRIFDPGGETYIRIQRRNYVRINTSIDVALHPKDVPFDPFTALTMDISGGGAAITIPTGKTIPPNGLIRCWFVLHMQSGETHYIPTICKIIRIIKTNPTSNDRVSLQFVEISDKDRQKVIRFCFEKQLATKR
ncbi:flagellar brake protein [Alkalihalobacterium elongatum]|uniref:flagellar brake protein n=1 Tax=Alkalihalobacterium elongatum TaxID=2675466 RepID=UPI001C1F51A2|nr:flagellar brake domain-containing protein [Alkalihalobacterium elongatum]